MADVELVPLKRETSEALAWQRQTLQGLMRRRREGVLPHALMFSGPAGVGKQHVAETLTSLLLCESPEEDIRACGHCKQCQLLHGEGHPDARLVEPQERSKVIRIDQIRQVGTFAMASPQVARCKVLLINRADLLNVSAANALLKTLEEPPSDTFLILLHRAGQPLLPTIRSRCQMIRLAPPPLTQATDWLAAHRPDVSAEDWERALDWAAGAPLEAARLLDDNRADQRKQCLSALQGYLRGDLAPDQAVRPFLAMPMEEALDLLLLWSRDLARSVVGRDRVSDPEAATMLGYLAHRNHPVELHRMYEQTLTARQGLEHNVNPEMEFMVLLDRWRALMPVKSGGAGKAVTRR